MIGDRLQMKLFEANRQGSNQAPQKRSFFQQPSSVRREVMVTTGVRETPPSRLPTPHPSAFVAR